MRLIYLPAVVALILGGIVVSAAELPVETFFRSHQYAEVRLSPDGNYLAALAPIRHRTGLVVVNLSNRTFNWAYVPLIDDVAWFAWANTNRLILTMTRDGYRLPGMIGVDRGGTNRVKLVHNEDKRTSFFALLPHSPDEILVTSWDYAKRDRETDLHFTYVNRMSVLTGHVTREVNNPGGVFRWVTDHDGVVRVGVAIQGMRRKVLYRSDAAQAWETLADNNYDQDEIEPLAFDYDNKTLFVGWHGDDETEGIYTFDVMKKQIKELAFRHAEADVRELVFSPKKKKVIGVVFQSERPEVYWFDPEVKLAQQRLDKALPDTVNRFVSSSRNGSNSIILATSDRNPGTFYLLTWATSKMEKLFEVAPGISPDEMAEMKPIKYTARDGLTIHGYLTLPRAGPGTNLPLIVNPHGGPAIRNTWGFDPEVQFLANRGYAVLRMNFRGSTGYGKTFLRAGYKQWGLKQQDDITDGVRWAIAQGIADPKRIAIYGASYGGYAALMGLEQTPELYRCGISYAGVTDIIRSFEKQISDQEWLRLTVAEEIGDLIAEKERLDATSPLNHADKIQVPVLLAYGARDLKVPVDTGRDLSTALRKRGKLYEFIVRYDEGHGFFKEANRIKFWKKVDEFLKANLQ